MIPYKLTGAANINILQFINKKHSSEGCLIKGPKTGISPNCDQLTRVEHFQVHVEQGFI